MIQPDRSLFASFSSEKEVLFLVFLFILFTTSAHAQRADAPFSGNALVPQGSPIPRILPPAAPLVSPGPALAPPPAPSAPAAATVPVRTVLLAGATAFPDARLRAATAGLTGPAVPVRRIEAARDALVLLYRDAGYVFTTVNARFDRAGVLRFLIVEGHITDVRLDGDIGPAGVLVLRFLRHLEGTRVLSNAALERWLLLAQDIPGVTLHAVLRPSPDEPGALTLVAQVSRQAVGGLLTVDNRNSPFTGPDEGLLLFDANSFTQWGERTELSVFHTDGNTQNFGQASENLFVGSSGLQVRGYVGYGVATPSGFLRDLDYHGYTNTFGLSAIYPLIRSRSENLNLLADFDVTETEIKSIAPGDTSPSRTSRDSLRIFRALAQYVRDDGLLGAPATDTALLRVSQGLPFLGGTSDSNPLPGRTGEQVGFFSVSGELARDQTLFAPWPGALVSLRVALLGQASPSVLPPSEKFFLGGTEIDRGYYSGQASGDDAFAQTVELDLATDVVPTVWGHPINVGQQYYAFFDHGHTTENRDTDPDETLSSEGIGARFELTRFLELDLEGDVRDTRLPVGTAGQVAALRTLAGYWRVLARF